MWKHIKENIGCIIFILCIVGIFVGVIGGCNHDMKLRKACFNSTPKYEEFKLVSLFDYQHVSKKSSLNGGFFLMMGAVSGNSTEDLKYYIRYAYEDKYGVKLMTEEINNKSKIRIKEVKNKAPKVIIQYKKEYWSMSSPECTDKEIMRIFEIPEGTIYKTFEIDMK